MSIGSKIINFLKGLKLENAFLGITLFFGILWNFLIPPFQTPDDPAHFCRAYMLSEGKILPERDVDGEGLGTSLPVYFAKVYKELAVGEIMFHPDKKADVSVVKNMLMFKESPDAQAFVSFYGSAIYSPVPYIAPIFGLAVAHLFDLPFLAAYYVSRLFNLSCFLILGYFSIKYMPFMRLTMFTIFFIPVFFQETASVNADVFTIGICLLFTAYVLHLAVNPNILYIGKKDELFLLLMAIGISLSKSVYFPICLIYFLIPKRKFSSKREYFLFGICLISFSLIFSAIWANNFRHITIPFPVNPQEQLMDILVHPEIFLGKIFMTKEVILDRLFILGWLDTPLSRIIKIFFMVLLFLPFIEKKEHCYFVSRRTEKLAGIICLLLFVMLYIVIHIALYVTWIQEPEIIGGVQGRYFIEFIGLLFAGIRFLQPNGGFLITNLKSGYYCVIVLLLLDITSSIYLRYW